MSSDDVFDRVYRSSSDPASQRALYDDWAGSYDRDLEASGYATPGRLARVLAEHLSDRDAPILDVGCGTGMSGRALADAGFTTIDGADLSSGMLDQAERAAVHRRRWQLTAGELDVAPGTYRAIVACGVIGIGAAPASTLPLIAAAVGPDDLRVFSFNDQVQTDDDFMSALAALADSDFDQVAADDGVHIASRNSTSVVYALRRTR